MQDLITYSVNDNVMVAAGEVGKKRALISVSDKRNLDKLAKGLVGLGFELLSTGGSASAISSYGVPVTKVESVTSFPEMLDGQPSSLPRNLVKEQVICHNWM